MSLIMKCFKVAMKRNFVYFYCIAKIAYDNGTSLVEFFHYSSFARYSTLLDMQIIHVLKSLRIMSIYKIVDFVECDNKKQLKLFGTCINYN